MVRAPDGPSTALTGATWKYAKWEKIDSNMDGFIALCTVLGKVRTVRLVDCGLGARSTAELAKVFRDADAALTKVDVRGNKGLDKAAVDALRAAALETCEILADY